eukprot:GHVS01028137.1.p1 GENE.GHVS01028137.1~~GHVS01028137.1.p1  ORF type:complete len:475 (-),score=84.90 GHVS01028137.1:150-1574(-)
MMKAAVCRVGLSTVLLFLQSISFGSTQGAYRCTSAGCFPAAGKDGIPVKENVPAAAIQYGTKNHAPAKHPVMPPPIPPPVLVAAPPLAKFHTPPPPPPPPRVFHMPAPNKKMPTEPSCVTPTAFGIEMDMNAIQDCHSLKVMAERGRISADSAVTGDKCDWLENDNCGTGDEAKHGGTALSRFRNRMENGFCLVFDTTPSDGQLRLQGGEDDAEAVVPLCCTPVCDDEEEEMEPLPQEPTEGIRDELLDLDETTTPRPPWQPPPPPATTPQPPIPEPTPISTGGCIDVKYLNFPRVENCTDLKDVATSTDYLHVTVDAALKCDWVDDQTCDNSFPDHGAWLDDGIPDDVCLAYRDSVCGDMVGPMPVLLREERTVCQRKGRGHQKPHSQMMGMVMMPTKKGATAGDNNTAAGSSGGSGGSGATPGLRRNSRFLMPAEAPTTSRSLQPRGKKEDGLPSSTTMPICCRLKCSPGGF